MGVSGFSQKGRDSLSLELAVYQVKEVCNAFRGISEVLDLRTPKPKGPKVGDRLYQDGLGISRTLNVRQTVKPMTS